MDQQQRDEHLNRAETNLQALLGPAPELAHFYGAWAFILGCKETYPLQAYDAALEWGRLFAEWSMRNGLVNRAGG